MFATRAREGLRKVGAQAFPSAGAAWTRNAEADNGLVFHTRPRTLSSAKRMPRRRSRDMASSEACQPLGAGAQCVREMASAKTPLALAVARPPRLQREAQAARVARSSLAARWGVGQTGSRQSSPEADKSEAEAWLWRSACPKRKSSERGAPRKNLRRASLVTPFAPRCTDSRKRERCHTRAGGLPTAPERLPEREVAHELIVEETAAS